MFEEDKEITIVFNGLMYKVPEFKAKRTWRVSTYDSEGRVLDCGYYYGQFDEIAIEVASQKEYNMYPLTFTPITILEPNKEDKKQYTHEITIKILSLAKILNLIDTHNACSGLIVNHPEVGDSILEQILEKSNFDNKLSQNRVHCDMGYRLKIVPGSVVKMEQEAEALKQSALSKLTKEEKIALGLIP